MSEAPDQPVVEETPTPGVEAVAPAATDDIDTEAFDRMPAPEDEDDASLDGDGDSPDPSDKRADAEMVEVEDEAGAKHRIPKALEGAFLKERDYRQKTQALAEQRRAVEAKQTELATKEGQQAESLRAFRNEHTTIAQSEAALTQLDSQLAEYRKVTPQDWATLRAQDPAGYQQHSDTYEFLRRTRSSTEDALDAARKDLTAKEAKLTQEQQAARTAALNRSWEETHQTLSRQIDGWNPQRFQDVAKFAVEQLGYKPEDLREAADARPWKMASDLMDAKAEIAKLTKALKQQDKAQNNAKAQIVTPAERPRGTAQPRGVKDDLTTDAWMRRRQAQVAKKA